MDCKRILETKRLFLRELHPTDAESFYRLNLDLDVLRYTGDSPFDSVENSQRFLENYDHYKRYGMGRWGVIRKDDGAFLGWCGLKFTEKTKEYDIGFRFFQKYWNKGYATEAAKACLTYGLDTLQIPRIIGRAMKGNKASIRVLEKIGLTYHRDFDFEGNKGVIYGTT
ncbi:MAG: GNAT family N-acetyltransferase [Bacteroidota bacterium]